MGDRCYMTITCRRQDAPRFEELGFCIQEDGPTGHTCEMVDEEANYAHSGDLPTDIPYYGENGVGGNYGAGVVACDGTRYAEKDCGHDGDGSFVVEWDFKKNRPTASSLAHIRHYISVKRAAENLLSLAACAAEAASA